MKTKILQTCKCMGFKPLDDRPVLVGTDTGSYYNMSWPNIFFVDLQ